MPSDSTLRKALSDSAREATLAGELVTVNSIRQHVEAKLSLDAGFFKSEKWKEESRRIINEAVLDGPEEPQSTAATKKAQAPPKSTTQSSAASNSRTTSKQSPQSKRDVQAETKPGSKSSSKKRQRDDGIESDAASIASSSSLSEIAESEDDSSRKRLKTAKRKEKTSASKARKSSGAGKPKDSKKSSTPASDEDSKTPVVEPTEDSESELSVLIDDGPPKKRSKSSETSKSKAKPSSKPSKATKDANLAPDEAEIKRLQSWLLKCGIRKLWHKELAPYDSPKAKISHLRKMLADVGMEGRYSAEKAARIKEERELKADIEAVQEGAKLWGNDAAETEEAGKPKRRLARGLKDLAMFDDDDESD